MNSEEVKYSNSLSSCAGSLEFSSRVAENCAIESLDESTKMNIPHLLECNSITDIRKEIPTPEIAGHYAYLLDNQEFIFLHLLRPTLSC